MVLPCTTVAKILVHGWIATAVIMGIVFVSSHAAAPALPAAAAPRSVAAGLSQRAAPQIQSSDTPIPTNVRRPARAGAGLALPPAAAANGANGALTARSVCAGLSRNRSGGWLRRGRQLGRLLHNHPRAGRRQQRPCSGSVRPSRSRTASPRLTACLRAGTTSSTGTRC